MAFMRSKCSLIELANTTGSAELPDTTGPGEGVELGEFNTDGFGDDSGEGDKPRDVSVDMDPTFNCDGSGDISRETPTWSESIVPYGPKFVAKAVAPKVRW